VFNQQRHRELLLSSIIIVSERTTSIVLATFFQERMALKRRAENYFELPAHSIGKLGTAFVIDDLRLTIIIDYLLIAIYYFSAKSAVKEND